MFLSDSELEQLTGYLQGKRQAEVLRKMGIPFHMSRRRPVVTWDLLITNQTHEHNEIRD
jgi:hypothetical protein